MKTMPIVVHALIFDMKNLLIRSSLFFTKDFCWLLKNWTLLYTLKTQWSKSLQDIHIGFNKDWSMKLWTTLGMVITWHNQLSFKFTLGFGPPVGRTVYQVIWKYFVVQTGHFIFNLIFNKPFFFNFVRSADLSQILIFKLIFKLDTKKLQISSMILIATGT